MKNYYKSLIQYYKKATNPQIFTKNSSSYSTHSQ